MATTRTVLLLTPEAPFPTVGGGPMRTACVLHYLIRSFDRVHVVTFREPGAGDPRSLFPSGVDVDVIDLPFHNKSAPARAFRNVVRAARGVPPLIDRFSGFDDELVRLLRPPYDLAVIEHFWAAGYGTVLRPHARRLALDLHNIESTLLARAALSQGFPTSALFRHWAERCRSLEAKTLPHFDRILATSAADAGQIAGLLPPDRQPVVVPNAIPSVPRPVPAVRRPHEVVFSGNMEYQPNYVAVRWFLSEIWPRIRTREPRLSVRFLGKNDHAIRPLLAGDPRLSTTGPVPDAVAALAESAAAIVPLLSGSGTRFKIIEAWAAGLPVISTSIGAEGLPAEPGTNILIADSAAEFADVVVKVVQQPSDWSHLGAGGRRLYEGSFSWEAAWKALSQAGL